MEGISVSGGTPHELIIAAIVEKTGWTYQDIIAQPTWLIDTLMIKWSLDSDYQKKQSSKNHV